MTSEDFEKSTPQEQLLSDIRDRDYGAAVKAVRNTVNNGHSPSLLSVLRSDLLVGFAQAWHASGRLSDLAEAIPDSSLTVKYKTAFLREYIELASTGETDAIRALPKFATSIHQLTSALELVLTHRQEIYKQDSIKPHFQFLATFDPQHIGHRMSIKSALGAAEGKAHAVIQVMGRHPRKTSLFETYERRYLQSEERIYRSRLLDNRRITQIDVPGGMGLATHGLQQMKLIADVCGDSKLRWLIGSDKFLLDTTAVRTGYPSTKSISRFSEPRTHVYVVYDRTGNVKALNKDIDYIRDRFGTTITPVKSLPYDCVRATSSVVKQLRAQGKDSEADHIELHELQSLNLEN